MTNREPENFSPALYLFHSLSFAGLTPERQYDRGKEDGGVGRGRVSLGLH
jgi:hypothetical protein